MWELFYHELIKLNCVLSIKWYTAFYDSYSIMKKCLCLIDSLNIENDLSILWMTTSDKNCLSIFLLC